MGSLLRFHGHSMLVKAEFPLAHGLSKILLDVPNHFFFNFGLINYLTHLALSCKWAFGIVSTIASSLLLHCWVQDVPFMS